MNTSGTARAPRLYDVVVVGGGNAGISIAARLIRRGVRNVAIVEPNPIHTYRPLLSYVGAGQATMQQAERTQRSVTPRGCSWIRDSVTAVDTAARMVHGSSGATYRYDDLVLAPGLVPDTAALPGITEALDTFAVVSNYLDRADETWKLVQAMPIGGRAVFTVPRPPVSCTGTTLKPLFLAAAHWNRRLGANSVEITLIVNRPSLLGVRSLDERLTHRLHELGVVVRYDSTVTALHPAQRQISVTDPDGTVARLPYDMLHLVPPFRGPRWLAATGLARDDAAGLIDVDPRTLRHVAHENVWAAGDAATVDTDPSGGALRRQAAILVDNLLAARTGERLSEYDGYTVAPVATGGHRLIAAEFDRSGALASSLPSFLDPLKPRRTAWAFDRYGLPRIYWNLILRGRA